MKHFRIVVIADDDPDDIELLQFAASASGSNLQIIGAEDGSQLLRTLDQIPAPDYILLDLKMPHINGYEALNVIRKNEKFTHTTIIIYAVEASKESIEKTLLNGANYFVFKPNSYAGVNALIKDISNGSIHNKLSNWG